MLGTPCYSAPCATVLCHGHRSAADDDDEGGGDDEGDDAAEKPSRKKKRKGPTYADASDFAHILEAAGDEYEFRGLFVSFTSLFRFLMGGVEAESFISPSSPLLSPSAR